MSLFNIALLQMTGCGWDRSASLEKGERFVRRARAMGADLALFPEMWSTGYLFYDPHDPASLECWKSQAISPQDDYICCFQSLASELDIAIGLTYLENTPAGPRNVLSLIDRRGSILFTYAKVHTCSFDAERALVPGRTFYTTDLDTVSGPVRVGAMICFDREFPESARLLMLQGAEVILVPNACGLEQLRLAQIQTRAYENMAAVAVANYAAPQENGHSVVFDGVACGSDSCPRDMLVVQAGEGEGIYLASLDLETLRTFRAREVWGDAYRRPELYQTLVQPAVYPPFVRPDAVRD